MSSGVCKHCTHAGCLDVCPTGALFRIEFGTVVVQGDICNGCGCCVAAWPYGVIGSGRLRQAPVGGRLTADPLRGVEAGIASTKDPKYVVVPQRERMAAHEPL
ncbi:4Fe-4S dicluster domain-containing protein [Blastococcus mobilis]|uniref:4Fe-4S dicluster domain-containing protein n=1 Tax=Blastococcus mobilis TaxID=1938746 RepID=A0A238WJ67_9ACTN|nr:4Fe-4S dicluster domain-containing protein [Blastococcus mobilis]SNR45719.1 4Fe-4S dicluster domain-containing protein [Blastococcus mobilis]